LNFYCLIYYFAQLFTHFSREELFLLNADTVIIEEITFGEQRTDESFARFPNGTGDFAFSAATFNANNGQTTSFEAIDFSHPALNVYPNPAKDWLTIEIKNSETKSKDMTVEIFDLYDRLVFQQTSNTTTQQITTEQFANGLYLIL